MNLAQFQSLAERITYCCIAIVLSSFCLVLTFDVVACSCKDMITFEFIPGDDGFLPSNSTGVAWWHSHAQDNLASLESKFKGFIIKEGTESPVSIKISKNKNYHLIYPTQGFVEGETYRFVFEDIGASIKKDVVVHILDKSIHSAGDKQPLKATINSPAFAIVPGGDGSCSTGVNVTEANVSMLLSPKLRIWKDQLLFRTYVNGGQWSPKQNHCSPRIPGKSFERQGHDTVYVHCDTNTPPGREDLKPGTYTIHMVAYLPGHKVVAQSEVLTIDINCK